VGRGVAESPTGSAWAPSQEWLNPAEKTDERHLGWLYLTLMTTLAAALRLFQLGHQSFWVDEIMTWRACRPDAGLSFWSQILESFQAPLYLAVMWPLVRVADSEFLCRLPSAIAGVATVPFLALVAQRLFDTRTARLSALLLALSPFHIWYSQEARGYAFLILFSVAASLVFLMMADNGPRRRTVVAYLLLMSCAVWSNMSALFLWAAHVLVLVAMVRPRDGRSWFLWLVSLGGVILVVSPWLMKATGIWAVDRLVPGSETGIALRGETTFTPLALPFTAFVFFYGYSLGPSLRELHHPDRLALLVQHWPLMSIAGIVVAVALVVGIYRLRGRQWSLVIWIVLPLLAVVFLALRNVKPFNPRYLAVVFPWLLLLASVGLLSLPRRWGWVLTVLLVGLQLWSVAGHHFDPHYAKADLREAAIYVATHEDPGDLVLVPVVTGVFRFYYPGVNELADSFGAGILNTEEEVRDFFVAKIGEVDRCWVVLARSWFVDPHDWLPRVVAQEGDIVAEVALPGVRILQWQKSIRESRPYGE